MAIYTTTGSDGGWGTSHNGNPCNLRSYNPGAGNTTTNGHDTGQAEIDRPKSSY